MADFCKQCSLDVFGEDTGDLKGLGDGMPLLEGHGWGALCESCGPIYVNDDGVCMSSFLKTERSCQDGIKSKSGLPACFSLWHLLPGY